MKATLKVVISVALIVLLAVLGLFRNVPLWASVFVGAGIQSFVALVIDICWEILR